MMDVPAMLRSAAVLLSVLSTLSSCGAYVYSNAATLTIAQDDCAVEVISQGNQQGSAPTVIHLLSKISGSTKLSLQPGQYTAVFSCQGASPVPVQLVPLVAGKSYTIAPPRAR
ncbi:MAG: hypothetical protein ACP5OR_05305 [Candidatus Dormibacteria bacterium]